MKLPEYYKINYKRFIELLNPMLVRSHLFCVLIWSCITPIVRCYVYMRRAIESFFSHLRYNATVLSLEEMLNSSFDPEQKRIALKNHDWIASNNIHSDEEETDDHFILFVDQEVSDLDATCLFTEGEHEYAHIFKLQIPNDLNEIKEDIKKKLAHYVPIGITFITDITETN